MQVTFEEDAQKVQKCTELHAADKPNERVDSRDIYGLTKAINICDKIAQSEHNSEAVDKSQVFKTVEYHFAEVMFLLIDLFSFCFH
jgi:hypothetical protein